MASNPGGNAGQSQNFVGHIQGARTNHTAMEVDSPPTLTTLHTMAPMNPSPALGNLQSVVGTNSTTHTTPSHSPLQTALQGGNNSSTGSSLNIGPQSKSVPPSVPAASQSYDSVNQILTRPRLHDLVREVDPTEQLDEEVEELLLQLADDFVETTVNAACVIAKHRKATTVDIKDIQLHLERKWNMWIPGFGTDEIRPYKRSSITEAHKQRLALIRKALKKY